MAEWSIATDSAVFSSELDVFHSRYPCSCDDLLTNRHGSAREDQLLGSQADIFHHGTRHISCLPPEILDEILCYLSIPSLDAARYVSKTWFIRVMSSAYVLSTVLGASNRIDCRTLSIAFDEAASLRATRDHADSWRTRFRMKLTSFRALLDESGKDKGRRRQHINTVIYAPVGNLLLLFVPKISFVSAQDATCQQGCMHIYRFGTDHHPVYVGSIRCPSTKGPPRVSRIEQVESESSWRMTVWGHSCSQTYEIRTRLALQGGESPYVIRRLNGKNALPRHPASESSSELSKYIFKDPLEWRLLVRLPLVKENIDNRDSENMNGKSYSERSRIYMMFEHDESNTVKPRLGQNATLFVAENLASGTLCLVSVETKSSFLTPDKSQFRFGDRPIIHQGKCRSIAIFQTPYDHVTYQNVAVSPAPNKKSNEMEIVRIAVIWQIREGKSQNRPELYMYEVPWSTGSENLPSTLRGMRISSLPPYFGGQHEKSSLDATDGFDAPSIDACCSFSRLGGLEFATEAAEPNPWLAQRARLCVWGPQPCNRDLGQCVELDVRMYDFSYADPARLDHSGRFYSSRAALGTNTVARKLKHLMFDGREEYCCCRLHDEAWVVTLPDVHVHSSNGGRSVIRTTSGFWPLFNTQENDIVANGNVGSVEKADSPERQRALARQDDWIKQRIVGMKKAGMHDATLKHLWCHAWWTRGGLVPRPRGWETKWEQWAEKMGQENAVEDLRNPEDENE